MSESFTTDHFRRLLESAKERFKFVLFSDDLTEQDIILWRHDVDFSPQRALALARIEAELGVKATYFVQLTSYFYSLFESGIATIFREIASMGHEIGVHFDPLYHETEETKGLEDSLFFEKTLLEKLIKMKVSVMSLHNPPTFHNPVLEQTKFAGMVNASAPFFRESFTYCSDSNGMWRFRDLTDVIRDDEVQRLYALTHPCWWLDENLSPRDKIQRCINGRAKMNAKYYDQLLETHGRPNIGKNKDIMN